MKKPVAGSTSPDDGVGRPVAAGEAAGDYVAYDQFIDQQLHAARRQVRTVDIGVSLTTLGAGTLCFFLLAALFDHWLLPGGLGTAGRWFALLLYLSAVLVWCWYSLIPLCIWRINPVYAAHAIERSKPSLKNSLINFLLLRSKPAELAPHVFDAIEQRAATELAQVPVEATIDRSKLIRIGYIFLALMLAAGVYKVSSPKDPLRTVGRIVLPWADLSPPTQVKIVEVRPGNFTAMRGQRVKFSAEVQGLGREQTVRLVYGTDDGQIVDRAVAMLLPQQGYLFECELPEGKGGIQQDLKYRVVAGDATSNEFRLTVQAAPTIVVESVDYVYPAYTGMVSQTVDHQGDLKAVEGTQVTLHAVANQPIKTAAIDFDANGSDDQRLTFDDRRAAGTFTLALKPDRQTPQHGSYRLRFTNADGQENPQPIRHQIEVTRDAAPEVEFLAPKREEIDLPLNGSLVCEVSARDPDFALARVALVGQSSEGQPFERSLLETSKTSEPWQGQFHKRLVLSPKKLGLKVGDVLEYWAWAEDNKTPEANRTETKHRRARIVTPAKGDVSEDALASENQQLGDDPKSHNPSDDNPSGKQPESPDEQPESGEQPNPPPAGADKPRKQNPGGKGARPDSEQQPPQPEKNGATPDQPSEGQDSGQGNDQPQGQQPAGGTASEKEKSGQEQAGKKASGKNESGAESSGEGQADQQPSGQGQSGQEQSDKPGQDSAKQQGSANQKGSAKQDGAEQGQLGDTSPRDGSQGDSGQPGSEQSGQPGARKQSGSKPAQGKRQEPVAQDGSQDGEAFQEILDRQNQKEQSGAKEKQGDRQSAGQRGDNSRGGKQPEQGSQKDSGEPKAGDQRDGQAGQKREKGDEGQNAPDEKMPKEGDQQPSGQSGGQPENDATNRSDPRSQSAGKQPRKQTDGGESDDSPTDDGQSAPGGNQAGKQSKSSGSPMNQSGGGADDKPTDSGSGAGSDNQGQSKSGGGQQDKQMAEKSAAGRRQSSDPSQSGTAAGQSASGDKPGDKPTEKGKQTGAGGQQRDGDPAGQQADGQPGQGEAGAGQKPAGNSGQRPTEKPANGEKSPGKSGAGQKDQGESGAGQKGSKDQPDSPQASGNNRPTKKSPGSDNKPDGDGEKSDSPPAASESDHQSDSEGGQDGDRDGGGKKGAGQQAQKSGDGGPGSHSEADEGGETATSKDGQENSNSPGGNRPAEKPTGQTGKTAGQGSSSSASPDGKQSQPADGNQSGKSDANPGPGDNPNGNPGKAGPGRGGGNPSESEPVEQPPPAPEQADAANLEFTRKATELTIQRMRQQLDKGQVDQELLDRLQWSREDMQRWVSRWEEMFRRSAKQGKDGQEARVELDGALRSLGLRPRASQISDHRRDDTAHGMKEGRRTQPPAEYRDQVRQYLQGISRTPGSAASDRDKPASRPAAPAGSEK